MTDEGEEVAQGRAGGARSRGDGFGRCSPAEYPCADSTRIRDSFGALRAGAEHSRRIALTHPGNDLGCNERDE